MRVVIYIVILAICFCIPVTRLDIAKLQPIEAVAVWVEQESVILKTDMKSTGVGKTVQEALKNLKESTPAVVYLDTADYLLVGEGAEDLTQEILPLLRKSVQVGPYRGGDVKEEAKFLDVHGDLSKPKR